jgi:uncharacterized cofD-like protein
MISGPDVVALGGGRGLSTTLRAVRRYAGRTTGIVATADDSGSTGRLRDAMAMPAPGDLRRCLAAIAGVEDEPVGRAMEYRFAGTDVEGHALGNLLLAGLSAVTGDFVTATDQVARLIGLDPDRGRVFPATAEPVTLRCTTADGGEVCGQYAISKTPGIARLTLEPAAVRAPDGVTDAIHCADQIVLGPGSVYTSVLAAALVPDARSALAATMAQRVYVCNIEPEPGETEGYDVAAHVAALRAHGVRPDVVLVHDGGPLALGDIGRCGAEVVRADLTRTGDAEHDSRKLAVALAAIA